MAVPIADSSSTDTTTTVSELRRGPVNASMGDSGRLEYVLERRRVCPVCMDSARDGAMVPCGHTACVSCASHLQMHRGTCAECNATIDMVLTLFGV